MLKKLLKQYLGDDEKVTQFMNDMKSNKIYLSREENIDTRYSKLQNDLNTKTSEHQQALELIEQLKSTNEGNETLQGQIAQYQTKIKELETKNKEIARDNAIKIALLSNKAKAEDIDYLMYKLSKDEEALKFDDNGELTNVNELIDNMKVNYSSHFEVGAKKKVDVQPLPKGDENKETVTKEQFEKMGYQEKNKLFHENRELYDKFIKGEDE